MRKRATFAGAIGAGLLMATAALADPYNPGERALGGGLLGAGTGAVLGAIAGGGRAPASARRSEADWAPWPAPPPRRHARVRPIAATIITCITGTTEPSSRAASR